jgi:soluble lytic murein transglycosylase-like protein
MRPPVARIASSLGRPAAAAVLLLASAMAQAQIYAGSEATTGAVVLSNFRTQEASMLVDGTSAPEPATAARTPGSAPSQHAGKSATTVAARPLPEIRGIVDRAASRHKLSPALLDAVILAESNYDARAVSPKGAIGLMQLLPTTGQRFGARDLFSVEQNVDAGASYLRWLMAMFDNHLDLVLAAYNAGERSVIDAGCRIPAYPETQAYVKRILDDLARRGAGPRRGEDGFAGGCA